MTPDEGALLQLRGLHQEVALGLKCPKDQVRTVRVAQAASGKPTQLPGTEATPAPMSVGEPDTDPAAVVLALRAFDEPVPLEAVDMLGHRRRADPLARCQLADPDPRRVLDADEERDLLRGRSQRTRLATELPAHLEEDRPEGVGQSDAVGFQQIVNSVNDS